MVPTLLPLLFLLFGPELRGAKTRSDEAVNFDVEVEEEEAEVPS